MSRFQGRPHFRFSLNNFAYIIKAVLVRNIHCSIIILFIFIISHINVRSLPEHFDELSHSPYLTNYDIIGISETWLNNSHFSSAYSLPGYSLVTRDHELTCRGGGMAFYVERV